MGKHDFEEIEQKLREAANTLTFDPRTIVLMASTEHCGEESSWFDVEQQKEYLNIIKVFFSDLGYHVSFRLNELVVIFISHLKRRFLCLLMDRIRNC